ncbi:MAG: site-2 protease family protein [Clostridia bacterium]|nr:site-2 protease family protein [Clostridia bacterium]MDD4571793.1 site-2 protease family protein [Clostridia bacterium]
MSGLNINIQALLYSIPAVLLALTFHEFSHGLVASWLGDDTPRLQGRLSLNPLRHLDPIGTLMLIFTRFGWAKPVMVNPLRFRGNIKVGMMLVALAGPLSNLFLALITVILSNLMGTGVLPYNPYFAEFFYQLFWINIFLAAFNIIPLPPLDGSKVLAMLLPDKYAEKVYSMGQYSILILVALSLTGIMSMIINPIATAFATGIMIISGIV